MLGIAQVELGWTARQFWKATVGDFWAAVDWIAERNLDQEDEYERIKAEAGGGAPKYKNAQGGIDVVDNPDLHVPDRPEWFAWAAQVKRDIASGRIEMEHIGKPAAPRQIVRTA